MQVTQVSTTVNGPQVSGVQTWRIDSAVGEAPPRFRQVLYLRFRLDGNADGVTILPAATRLRGRFLPYDYDAMAVTNPALLAQLSNVGNAVLVELDAPRQLRAVRLRHALAPGAGSKVTVHRVDGEQVVEAATATAGWVSAFTTAAVDLAHGAFNRVLPLRATPGGATGISNVQAQKVTQASNVAALAVDFTDARFGLRLSNSPTTLTANHLAGLTVRSYPSAPRIGLAAPQTLAAPTFFLRLAGEIGKDGADDAGLFTADALLAATLQQHVDTFFTQLLRTATSSPPQLPDHLTVALVLEADAPCQLQLEEFVVGYHLVRRNFPDYAEKQVLRFAGTALETQSVHLRLPTAATVTQAALTIVPKLGAASSIDQSTAPMLPPNALNQATGIHLGLERWAAQPLTPPQAFTAAGALIGLVGLTPNTVVTLAIYEDWQGQPAGKQLTTVTFPVAPSGQRRWQTVDFAEPVLLFAQPYWLLLKAVRGTALWLAQPGATAVQMLTKENQHWQTVSVVADTAGLVQLLTPLVRDKVQRPTLALTIGHVPVTTLPVATGDRQTYDLTTALPVTLNGLLTTTPTTGMLDVAINFTTGQSGVLTVYAPMVTYSLTG